jgi:hypothetical protein
VVLFFPVRPAALARTVVALAAALALAGCATTETPRRASESPTVRCVDEPGRGGSVSPTRPLFFLFCAQSP